MEVARASRRGEESILIGHAGHPEVEGTMGQYSNPKGNVSGRIARRCETDGQNEEKLSFMTQTTLSVDDTSDVIDACVNASRKLSVRAKMTSATPRLTVRKRYAPGRAGGSSTGGWFEKLFQLQPSGGTGPAYGQTRVLIDDATDIQKSG